MIERKKLIYIDKERDISMREREKDFNKNC